MSKPNNQTPDGDHQCKHGQHADCPHCLNDLYYKAFLVLDSLRSDSSFNESENITYKGQSFGFLKDLMEYIAGEEYPNA